MSIILETSRCETKYGISPQDDAYQNCVGDAVADGLGDGKLSKSKFYKLLIGALADQMAQEKHIPSTIYLQVWHRDRWPETYKAIANALDRSVNTWAFSLAHKNPDPAWLSVTGVAIGASLMLVLLAFGTRFSAAGDLLPLLSLSRPLLLISWISAAVGLASVFKIFLGFFSVQSNPYLYVVTGVITAFLCGAITQDDDEVKTTLRTARSTKIESSL